jgi:hypothetical protein
MNKFFTVLTQNNSTKIELICTSWLFRKHLYCQYLGLIYLYIFHLINYLHLNNRILPSFFSAGLSSNYSLSLDTPSIKLNIYSLSAFLAYVREPDLLKWETIYSNHHVPFLKNKSNSFSGIFLTLHCIHKLMEKLRYLMPQYLHIYLFIC